MGWILRKFLKNMGCTYPGIYRSGQPGIFRLPLLLLIVRPKTRINLAFSPDKDKQDSREKRLLEKSGIKYYGYAWSAGGPTKPMEVEEVLDLLNTAERPIWIGCEGGKDRAGGIIGIWKCKLGFSLYDIIEEMRKHKVPSDGWLKAIFK